MIIPAGSHRPTGMHIPAPYLLKKSIHRKITFDASCKYDLGADQTDVNKLYGIGYVHGFEKWPPHHFNSARFGWYYNLDLSKVMLMAYCYIDGARIMQPIMPVLFYRPVHTAIIIDGNNYVFTAEHNLQVKEVVIPANPSPIGYELGMYFGGRSKTKPNRDNVAPHTMKISIE